MKTTGGSTTSSRPFRLLLTGGGTGGHLFPAIAAAEELCERMPGATVVFVGTRRKMDKSSLERYGYAVTSIYSYGLKGKSAVELIKAVAVLPLSLLQAMACILRFRPDVVLGVGGYVTGPVVAAARMLGRKTVIHEQNSIPGLANRKLGRMVDRVCISLPESANHFPAEKTVLTGNPVRKPLLELAGKPVSVASKSDLTLLILGGSQGAHRINELAVEAICDGAVPVSIKVIHQSGTADYDMVKKRYREHGISAEVQPFFQDMAAIYSKADLLVSRAGATTLAELAVLGKPAILVPYPHAADDHQHKNADYYVAGGGCLKFAEHELNSAILAKEIGQLAGNEKKRAAMADAMKKLAKPEAAASIVDECLESWSEKQR